MDLTRYEETAAALDAGYYVYSDNAESMCFRQGETPNGQLFLLVVRFHRNGRVKSRQYLVNNASHRSPSEGPAFESWDEAGTLWHKLYREHGTGVEGYPDYNILAKKP